GERGGIESEERVAVARPRHRRYQHLVEARIDLAAIVGQAVAVDVGQRHPGADAGDPGRDAIEGAMDLPHAARRAVGGGRRRGERRAREGEPRGEGGALLPRELGQPREDIEREDEEDGRRPDRVAAEPALLSVPALHAIAPPGEKRSCRRCRQTSKAGSAASRSPPGGGPSVAPGRAASAAAAASASPVPQSTSQAKRVWGTGLPARTRALAAKAAPCAIRGACSPAARRSSTTARRSMPPA